MGFFCGSVSLSVTHLDPIWREAGRRALLEVCGQVLVDVLEDEVQRHLPLAAGAVADVKQSEIRKEGRTDQMMML